jgi:DNA-nicking Smr family endonuclease
VTKSEKPATPIVRVPAPRHGVPPLTGLDRRSERRMTRGQVEIEGRIDLHGTGIERSRERLLNFLATSRADGLRLVLVITGKGASPFTRHTLHGADHFHAPERQGRLRRLVPEWFHEGLFREHIAGFQPAHPRHGGGGAFYVKLRKKAHRAP